MAERLKAAVLKTVVPGRAPGVRIPLPPPTLAMLAFGGASGLQALPNGCYYLQVTSPTQQTSPVFPVQLK